VLKIGGSLLKYPIELSRLCNLLADLSGELDLLIVPGGGIFADVVRDVHTRLKLPENIAHQMAILSMDQYGILIQSLSQVSSQIIENIDDSKKCFEEHKIAILQVSNIMKSENRLPKSWSVTSDSIAAFMAQLIGAKRLLLVKSIDGLTKRESGKLLDRVSTNSLDSDVKAGSVDGYFPNVLKSSSFQCFVVNGRFPERVESILRGDNTVCTEIVND
jgi:aspartokinase-like uncharacterized kinase|tara:strand:- start:658 stop:1308 length:651 start_codon:yes stop_codon:yes gene_type:complete